MPAHDHSNHGHGTPPGASGQGDFWTSRAFLVFLGFGAIAVVLLWKEHSAHLLGALPFLLLLACPLLHVFMHGGHGGHGGHRAVQGSTQERGPSGSRDPTKGDRL